MTFRDDTPAMAWDRPVFIITTGRSGSTLLLRYLNCAEGLVVWGEHAGVLRELAMAYRRLIREDTVRFVESARPWVAELTAKRAVTCPNDQMTIEWVNGFDTQTIDGAFRRLLLSLFTVGLPETTRWGFKEIHYGRHEMNMLRALFAAPKFLILRRDPAAILKSKLKAFAKGKAQAMGPHIAETRAFFESAAEEAAIAAPDVLFLRYEDLAARPEPEIARIAAFIDAPFSAEAVAAIASERAGRPPRQPEPAADETSLAERLGLAPFAAEIDAILALDRQLTAAMPAAATALAA